MSVKRLTTKEFIQRAVKKHKDRYDYSKTNYVRSDIKVTIICNIHGPFEQEPQIHLMRKGCGCPYCGKLKPFAALPINTIVPYGKIAIPLTQGKYTIIDESDFDKVSVCSWYYAQGYAVGRPYGSKKSRISMHKYIMTDTNEMIDHINGDRLNNSRSNLRSCTPQQNCFNAKNRKGTSNYKGVTKRNGKYYARITKDGKTKSTGTYLCEIEAAKSYDKKAIELHGDFARLNFPIDSK